MAISNDYFAGLSLSEGTNAFLLKAVEIKNEGNVSEMEKLRNVFMKTFPQYSEFPKPSILALKTHSWIFLKKGKYFKALELECRVLEINPNDWDSRKRINVIGSIIDRVPFDLDQKTSFVDSLIPSYSPVWEFSIQ